MNLKKKISLCFMLLSGVVLIGVSSFSYINIKEKIVENINTNMKTNVVSIENELEGWVEGKIKIASTAVEILKKEQDMEKASPKIMESYKHDKDILNMYIGFEKDGGFVDGGGWVAPPDYDPRIRPWYVECKEKGKAAFSNPYKALSGDYRVTYTVPLMRDGSNLDGVIGVDVGLKKLSDLTSNMSVSGKGHGFLLDSTGTIIAHPNEEFINANVFEETQFEAVAKKIRESDSGSVNAQIEGEERTILYSKLESTGWYLGISVPESMVYSQVNSIRRTYYAINVIALVALLAAAILISSKITRPITRLKNDAEKMSSGDLAVEFEVGGKDEISMLSNSLQKMTKNIKDLIGNSQTIAKAAFEKSDMIFQSVQKMGYESDEIACSANEISTTALDQSEKVQYGFEVTGVLGKEIESLDRHIESVSESAVEMNKMNVLVKESIEDMSSIYSENKDSQKNISDGISAMLSKSKSIENIVGLINDVAEETNLLSLNASIEAARAGEHGAGFSVVADEVGKLSERSAKASREIRNTLNEIVEEIINVERLLEDSVDKSENSNKSISNAIESFARVQSQIEEIVSRTELSNKSISEIRNVKEEMISSIEGILEDSHKATASTQEISASIEEQAVSVDRIKGSVDELNMTIKSLNDSIRIFKL